MSEVTHACPPEGSGRTPCCGRTPFELPGTDRMTLEPALVNCAEGGAVMSTTEPTDEMVDKAMTAYAIAWQHQPFTGRSLTQNARDRWRAALGAALAVAPAPSEDERRALARLILEHRCHVRGIGAMHITDYDIAVIGLPEADTILAAGWRRSPVSPPEDVVRRVGLALYGVPYDQAHAAPDVWDHLVEEQDRKVAAVLAALRAPVPVEVQYRARAADGYVYGESRTTPETAVAAYEEALDRVTLEQADETPVVEERAVTPWVLFRPTREEENR